MDIDIDFKTDFDPKREIPNSTYASMVLDGVLKKHPVGAYLQDIPVDNVTELAAIPYNRAEELGYFKIDFLHLNLLDCVESKEELKRLMHTEPDWTMLESANVVEQLFQIHKHFSTIYKIKPTSVVELADCIALIRPGKYNLINSYINNKNEVRKVLYVKQDNDKFSFKKSHAIAYAFNIIIQLNLIREGKYKK